MNKEKIKTLCDQAELITKIDHMDGQLYISVGHPSTPKIEKLIELVVKECIDSIETYKIPVGNSAAGEMACEWTYDALTEIRDEIKEKFGLTNQ